MNVTSELVDRGHLQCRVFLPAAPGRYPAVIAYSDIFQQTQPHLRYCARLASHGLVVVSPELYGRFLAKGTALRFDDQRQQALDAAAQLELEWFENDLSSAIAIACSHPRAEAERLSVVGFCIGGHLAFRAALRPEVKKAACFYPTGLHTDTVGAAQGTARSLAAAAQLRARLLLVWGTRDPHIPAEGRHKVHAALAAAGIEADIRHFDAEHAFARDEGARWDPAAADEAFRLLLTHLAR